MAPLQPKTGRVLLVVAVVTLAVFGALVFGFTIQLRQQLRSEVLRREAEAIHAVALLQLEPPNARLAQFAEEFALDDAFAAVLESSRLKGVLAVQLFDAGGTLRLAEPLAPEDAERSRWWPDSLAEPRAQFVRAGAIETVSPLLALRLGATARMPLLEIAVPLYTDGQPAAALGVARYWVDGRGVAAEFRRMDNGLARQAGLVFLGAVVVVGLVFAGASARLTAANRRLLEQSADLARANQELDFAAKTGALGAISAHLIHGLKNPLAGLEGFVAETAGGVAGPSQGEAWHAAMETTRRLRALVNEVVAVLRDESEGDADYPVPVAEVVEAARMRAAPAAARAGVEIAASAEPEVQIPARAASFAGLVLANLIPNAIEATSAPGRVEIAARRNGSVAELLVSDGGPGLPDFVRDNLFHPVQSTKRGGGGLGLAISYRLAKHADGDLELMRSDAQGTVFRLTVPVA